MSNLNNLYFQLRAYLNTTTGFLHLPHGLLSFFHASQIRKVGVHVSGDLTRLFNDCGFDIKSDPPFLGALELGKLAKEKTITPHATISLADLCASVLRRFLPKDPSIRVSPDWNTTSLTTAQANYAALDVFALWSIFKALTNISIGKSIQEDPPAGTLVSVYSADHSRPVAYGHIAPDQPTKFQGVNITKTRVLVTITSILVPGHIIPGELLPTKQDTPLKKFTEPPFSLICKLKHLRLRTTADELQNNQPLGKFLNQEFHAGANVTDTPLEPVPYIAESDGGSFHQWYNDLDAPSEPEQKFEGSECDPQSKLQAEQIQTAFTNLNAPPGAIRSRVLGDIWHLMHQFPISMAHGLRRPFARALRDAFFIYDPEDKANIEVFLATKGLSWSYMIVARSEWLLQRVRRVVPPPEQLLFRVSAVLYSYGPLRDSTSGLPLFNSRAWDITKNVLENIRRGYYSDPPNISLYYPRAKDKYGLQRYKCCRGTNGIEGGVHQNIIRWFGAFNASPEFAVELLRDYTLYHNMKVYFRTELIQECFSLISTYRLEL
jgi:hypothetical protein